MQAALPIPPLPPSGVQGCLPSSMVCSTGGMGSATTYIYKNKNKYKKPRARNLFYQLD